jgi:Flp pilus assembly protein TadG
MDAFGKIITLKNKKGITLIVVAILIVLLMVFIGLAVDIGYMYVTKGQLQNAADSAALAGATCLEPDIQPNGACPELTSIAPSGPVQQLTDPRVAAAKSAAVNLAAKNKAAGIAVAIDNAGNTLSDSNDVTVGFWNTNNVTYTEGGTPINAIMVRTRRTANSPGGQVAIYFGKVLSVIPGLSGWGLMSASGTATAGLPPRATAYISVCTAACPSSGCLSYPNGQDFSTGPQQSNFPQAFAWTTFSYNPTSANVLSTNFICKSFSTADVCNQSIWSTMGGDTSVLRDFASLFYDPTVDSSHKQTTTVTISTGRNRGTHTIVTGWDIIVPVTTACPPGQQGSAFDPKPVSRTALVHITAVCASGGGNPCWNSGNTDVPDACVSSRSTPVLPAKNCCSNFTNNTIVIDSICCTDCSAAIPQTGLKPVLVPWPSANY